MRVRTLSRAVVPHVAALLAPAYEAGGLPAPSGFEICLRPRAHDTGLLATAHRALVEAALEAGVP